MTLSLGAKIIY